MTSGSSAPTDRLPVRETLQLCWVETLGQILAGNVIKAFSHNLRFSHPEML